MVPFLRFFRGGGGELCGLLAYAISTSCNPTLSPEVYPGGWSAAAQRIPHPYLRGPPPPPPPNALGGLVL